jgi:hypothetical protein
MKKVADRRKKFLALAGLPKEEALKGIRAIREQAQKNWGPEEKESPMKDSSTASR